MWDRKEPERLNFEADDDDNDDLGPSPNISIQGKHVTWHEIEVITLGIGILSLLYPSQVQHLSYNFCLLYGLVIDLSAEKYPHQLPCEQTPNKLLNSEMAH